MQDEETYDLRQLFAILKRQSRLILLILVMTLGAALLYLIAATPIYSAKTLVYVDPEQKNLLDPQAQSFASRAADSKLESEVGILGSDAVALETIDKLNLLSEPEYRPSLGRIDRIKILLGMNVESEASGAELLNAALQRFKENTNARRRGLTYLIEVSADSTSPENAAELSRGLAETYINHQLRSKIAAAENAGALLESQTANARAQLARTEEALDGFIDNNIDRIEEAGGAEIAALRQQASRTGMRADALRGALANAESALGDNDLDALVGSLQSTAVASLASERNALKRRLEDVSNLDQARDLRTALAEVESKLESQANREISSLRNDLSTAENEQGRLRETLRARAVSTDLPPELLADLYQIQQEADIAQQQYANLLTRSRDLQAQALVQVADSRIVSPAVVPQNPSSPNTKLILAISLILGLGLGIAAAFMRDLLVGGVTSMSELEALAPGEIAGPVPKLTMGRGQLSPADSIISAPLSGYSESVRQTRATVDQIVPATPGRGRVIAVTSSIPSEGKTSTCIAMARTYDQAGYRTLLIDGDFRKPLIHKNLGLPANSGFAEYLASEHASAPGEHSDISFATKDPSSKVAVVLGKSQRNLPTDQLLQSANFAHLIEQARHEFDVIILDCSPVLPVADARFALPYSDAVIFCVSYNNVQKSDVREALRRVASATRGEIPVVTLLNGDESNRASYKYSGYYTESE